MIVVVVVVVIDEIMSLCYVDVRLLLTLTAEEGERAKSWLDPGARQTKDTIVTRVILLLS